MLAKCVGTVLSHSTELCDSMHQSGRRPLSARAPEASYDAAVSLQVQGSDEGPSHLSPRQVVDRCDGAFTGLAWCAFLLAEADGRSPGDVALV
jgi:hypothetical protein